MADQITDNRTLIDDAESVTPYDDLSGSAGGTLDDEIFIQGSNSIGEYTTNTVAGTLFDAGTVQTSWANSTFYIWINCSIVGLLATKTNGGMRIRFAGQQVGDYFEVNVAGSDDWPPAIAGGWTQFVVDIEDAEANPSDTGGGNVPTTSQVRYVGWAAITAGVMPRMVDNTWIDEIRRLPTATPGIIIEGRDSGSSDWTSSDIYDALGDGAGTFVPSAGGAWKVNTPVQFGINDTSTHAFTDTNAIWLWDNQEFLVDGFYDLSALGNSGGTTNVTFGVKSGTGSDATGSQGFTISADTTGIRWGMDFNDPNLDGVNFYGCSFQHGENFLLDDVAVSAISTLYIDCDSAAIANSEQLRVSTVNANTADSVAFMNTDDVGDVEKSSFLFSDGHAIALNTGLSLADGAFQAGATLDSGVGAVTANWPTHLTDDIAILAIETQFDETPTLSTPAGFTLIESIGTADTGGEGTRLTLFWHRATSGSMTDPVIADPGDHAIARIETFRGLKTTGNPWLSYSTTTDDTATTSITVPAVTTEFQDNLVYGVISHGRDSASAWASGQTNAGLTSITERNDEGAVDGNGGGLSTFTAVDTVAGSTGTTAVTDTGSSPHASFMFALGSEVVTLTLQDLTYSGYGANGSTDAVIDIEDTTGNIIFNISGGDNPTVKTDGASFKLVNSSDLEFTNLVNPTEVRVYDNGTIDEVAGTENVTTGTVSYSIDAATFPTVDVVIHSIGYVWQKIIGIDMTGGDLSIPVQQQVDRVYENP